MGSEREPFARGEERVVNGASMDAVRAAGHSSFDNDAFNGAESARVFR